MRQVLRSALVAQPAARMFALINDIERYPAFVPWCSGARVESRTELEIVATLDVKRGPLRAQFTTRNTLEPESRVRMQLVRGPFSTLEGEWRLSPVGDIGCRVELALQFAFANGLQAMIFEPLFEETAGSLVDAFVARSRIIGADA